MNTRIEYQVINQVAWVTLNRPDKLNALDLEMFIGLDRTIKNINKNRSIRAVVLTGAGDNFCSGLDVKSVMSSPTAAVKLLFKWLPWRANLAQRVSTGWRHLSVPVVAMIHGKCWGGGLQIALGADFIVAHQQAEFSIMESRWGLIPDMGGTLALRERLTLPVAKELAMTARIISACDAKALGLIDNVSEQPQAMVDELLNTLLQQSPDSVAATKCLYNRSWWSSIGLTLLRESYYQILVLLGKNQKIKTHNQRHPDDVKPFKPRRFK
ncbi:crotonase/enoyl-CoA hydratase family protein [Thalassotalea ganghwensis]